ncbi:hypothetical protein SLS53_007471 [Cytospora paraplurivora]|uniref:Ubiquitin-like domain-containing protein n=1 Tax=Cytospora paraplurivora TaxID=2898453 RepID=A0AAN9YCG8_9PEZI
MSAHIYVTFGGRTVMMAKPATYQDLKREIRNHFPMLGSVSSMVILWKGNDHMTGNWIEVVDSAYSVIPNGAELLVNVAEPITKRYIFPLPDGRNSNVGPLNKAPLGGGSPMRDNHTGQQVSINKPKTSKYNYPGSESSFKLERSVGAACASGWAIASERFRRSAKLVPNLEDCKEAVGLEVGESNCYPDEDGKNADKLSGHVQHQHYDSCSRACTHECDCELCLQERDGATLPNTDSAPRYAAGQNGEATAHNTPDPYENSPRGWADMPNPHTVTPHRNSAWGVDDYRKKENTGSGSSHDDYTLGRRDDSPDWPYPWRSRAGGGGWSGAHEEEEYADRQYARTAIPWNSDHVQRAWDTVPASNRVQASNQTALDMANHCDARNAYLLQGTNQTALAMADHYPVQHPSTRPNPARVSTGSPIAKPRRPRRPRLPHWTTRDQERDKRANAVDQQAQNQDIENGMHHPALLAHSSRRSGGPAHHTPMSVYARRLHGGDAGSDDDHSAEDPDHHDVDDDHWYASPQAAFKRYSPRGGSNRSGGGAMYGTKGITNTSRQMEHYGWRLDKQGPDGPHRPEKW